MDTHLHQLMTALESATEGMSYQQMSWRLPGKWCATEVLEHLYLTYTGTIKGFERLLETGKPMVTRASAKQRLRTLVVINLGYFPTGRKTPPVAEPRGLPPDKVRSEWRKKIEEMDAVITQCEALFGHAVPMLDHPVLGPLTATQWRKFHFIHGLHHCKQLLRLRQASATD